MPYCAVLQCKNDSRNKNLSKGGISYHRFPKAPDIKEKWIDATGRQNWFPTKTSTICSEHFEDNVFIIKASGNKYLADTAIPNKKILYFQSDTSKKVETGLCSETLLTPTQRKRKLDLGVLTTSTSPKTIRLDTHLADTAIFQSVTSKNVEASSETFSTAIQRKRKLDFGVLTKPASPKKIRLGTHLPDTTFQSNASQNVNVGAEPSSEPSFLLMQHKPKLRFDTYSGDNNVDPSSAASTPRKKKLKGVLRWKEGKIQKQKLEIRRLKAQNRRLKKKVNKIEDILKTLKEKFSMSNENITNLKNTNVKVHELVTRQVQNLKSGTISKQLYSPELRSFALTLHYYSPKAYDYARSTFNSCLPHPQTLKKWYAKIGGEPGFTKESFIALKLKADSSSHPLLATLVIDEMAIRRRIEWDGQKFYGYVDVGTGLDGDHLAEAKEVLVFLITAINGNFKVPVAFFLVDGVTGEQRSELVKQCIERVHEVGIKIVALTFDGCAANVSMARHLGCSFQDQNVKFEHPVTKDPIVVILDPCHMIKLIRNTFESSKSFVDKDGKKLQWQYLVELNKIQEDEKFHLSNKLRDRHINFQNQRMKVKLATQLFSLSVVEAMQFCRKDLRIVAFKESEATEKFLLLINNMFDIFNSRNLHQYGFKKALNESNAAQIFDYLNMACDYISNLKHENGTLLTKSLRKTGFLGFLGCAEALKYLYSSLIHAKIIIYLPFYKLSQDHLELLFGNIRAHGGSNNNPTARQFVAAYKKLLIHVELKDFGSGNCTALEELSILNCSSAVERINKTTGLDLTQEDWTEDNTEEQEIGELLKNLSEFSSQAIAHIAGYIARILIKKVNCDVCVGALISKNTNSLHKFIVAKDKGGLIYPSSDMIKICKVAETVIRSMDGLLFKKEVILTKILQKFIGEKCFEDIKLHQVGEFPTANHVTDLIKAITERYINVRIHHLLKINVKLTKRQLLNKYVLFQGQ